MATQYLAAACHSNISGSDGGDTERRASESIDEMSTQMEDYNSNNNWKTYGYSGFGMDAIHNWHPTADASTESDYIDKLADEIGQAHRDGDIYVVDGDVWCVSDAFETFGYGRAEKHQIDTSSGTKRIGVARILDLNEIPTADPDKMQESFTIHEAGHLIMDTGSKADHKKGDTP